MLREHLETKAVLQNGIASSVGLLIVCGVESIYLGAELDCGSATFSGTQTSSSSSTGLPLPCT